MQNIFDIHDYDDHFIEQFISQTIPIYDLWSIRPLQNQNKELIAGTSNDAESFREFIAEHSLKDYPHPLVIMVGNSEKGEMARILNTSKKFFKVKFDKFKGNDLGTPLEFNYGNEHTEKQNVLQNNFQNSGQRPQLAGMQGMSGMSYNEMQGIIDRNVSDATRSIKADYEEVSARREAESIKRIADIETKMEYHKLDIRAREIEDKERKFQDEVEAFNAEKSEGLGSVKDYTKTIASGLLELGKAAFGIDDFIKKDNDKPKEKEVKKENLKGANISDLDDDDGFTIKDHEKEQVKPENNNAFVDLIGAIKSLNEEQKYQLLEVLMPEEEEIEEEKPLIENNTEEVKEEITNETNTEENEKL